MSTSVAPVTMRDAATVMLVRDGIEGLEVFMLLRNLNSDFVGGAYVFPGGGVDGQDHDTHLDQICCGRTDAQASAQLGIERGGLAFWVAAIRESFEEAGVLLAYSDDGNVIPLTNPEVVARFNVHRTQVDAGERRLVDVCADEGLRLAVDAIHYFSHWITPEGAPRRYDTRFFVAAAPPQQTPLHDNREAVDQVWIRPTDALARHRAGEFDLIFPTIRSLAALQRFATAADVLSAAAAINEVPTYEPKIVEDEGGGGFRILLPGDAGYDQAVAVSLPAGVPMNKLNLSGDT
jgi:8-oxo-dGTP pyrophosphatase MutT (NUDIX family)